MSSRRIYSTYLDELENVAVHKVAAANGASPNAIIRAAVRRMLGLPAMRVEIPDEVAEWAAHRAAAARL